MTADRPLDSVRAGREVRQPLHPALDLVEFVHGPADQAESFARWRIEDTGGTIRVFDGDEPRVVTAPRGNS